MSAQDGSDKPRAKYAEIEAALRARIADGSFALGDLLPTEQALCAQLSASRFTVRQALGNLRKAGLVEARAGVGTYVVRQTPREVITHSMSSFEELLRYPGETYRRDLSVQTLKTSAQMAHLLGVPSGRTWVHLTAMRLIRATDAPISWLNAYLRPDLADVLDLPNPEGASLLSQIEAQHDLHAAQAQVEIFVGRIDDDIATPMQCEAGAPAMIILRRYKGADGEVYLVTSSIHPENRFALNFEFQKQTPTV